MSSDINSSISNGKSNNHVNEAPSLEQYEEHISTIRNHAGCQFVQVRLDHVCFLNGDGNAAIVLSYLLNIVRMKDMDEHERKLLIRNKFWFRCPLKNTRKHTGMKRDKVDRIIKTLVKNKLIEVQHRAGNALWIKVSTETLKTIENVNKDTEESAGNPQSYRVRETRSPS